MKYIIKCHIRMNLESAPRQEGVTAIIQEIRERYKKTPFSIKGALAIAALVGAPGQEAHADSENISTGIAFAKEELTNAQKDIYQKIDGSTWRGVLEYSQSSGAEGVFKEDFPDFPQHGTAETFEMYSTIVLAVENGQIFEGQINGYSLKSGPTIHIVPNGERSEINVVLEEDVDKDQQIVEAIAAELGFRKGQYLEGEERNGMTKNNDSIVEHYANVSGNKIVVPLASWDVLAVTDENHHITGYTITIEYGEIETPDLAK